MLAHICFTLIIHKQFNFSRFKASVYTNVDRLCAVFLYTICCFHDFFETSAPIEKHWKTLIHYKNDVNTEHCFQNGGRLSSRIWENFHFWSRELYLHAIPHRHSEFRINRPIRRRDIAKKVFSIWRPYAYLNLRNFDFFVKFPCSAWTIATTKFHRNRLIHG